MYCKFLGTSKVPVLCYGRKYKKEQMYKYARERVAAAANPGA